MNGCSKKLGFEIKLLFKSDSIVIHEQSKVNTLTPSLTFFPKKSCFGKVELEICVFAQ